MLSPLRLFPRFACALVLSSLLALAAGCGSRTGTVSGKVTYQKKPVTAGMVQFFPEGKGGDFSASIKEDGSYTISKLPPGPTKIVVFSNTNNPMMNVPMMGGRAGRQRDETGLGTS